jgi:hypothetical protein
MDGKFRCAAWVLATVLALSGIAHATDDSAKGAARELANEAKSDFDAGNFEAAGSKFQRAYEIAKVPTLAVWAARSLVKRGHLVAASELYRQAALLAPNDLWIGDSQQQAQADAEKELAELRPRIAKLHIRVEGAAVGDVELTVDDVKIATALLGIDIPTDPGRRRVVGKRGAEVVDQTVELGEGERKEAVLKFNAVVPSVVRIPIAPEAAPAHPETVRREERPPAVPLSRPPVANPVPFLPTLVDSGKSRAGDTEALDLHQKPSAEEGGAASGAGSHWWVWTAIGTAVAGGIVTAVVLSTRNPGRDGSCSPGLAGCTVVGR